MTKQATPNTSKTVETVVNAHFAEVYWNPAKNRRDKESYGTTGQATELRESLRDKGWIVINPAFVYPMSQADKDECLKERQTKWDALKDTTKAENLHPLHVFESLYTVDGKGKKLIEPKFNGNSGFRRHGQYFDAQLERYTRGDEILTTVPVVVKHYKDEVDRIIDQQLENEIRSVGVCEIPDLNKLRIVRGLYEMGVIENRVRELYKTTMAQKLYGICRADNLWPELKIYDRFFITDTNNPDFIPFSKPSHKEIIPLNNRTIATRKRENNEPLTQFEKELPNITQEEVDKYFRDCRTGSQSGNEKKIMPKTEIKGLAEQHKIDLVKMASKAVYDNDTSPLYNLMEHADSLNSVTKMVNDGKGSLLAKLIYLQQFPALVDTLHSLLTSSANPQELTNYVEQFDSQRKAVAAKSANHKTNGKGSAKQTANK